ncbi:hypothetical protein FisN_25Lu201 [Fistulifera solaris]|uniref:JmjC domain-containing protein n=1 Tax=Fistulifera solaris TaxID=1519565 RepID=A0A1Z5KR44_FISSO|nr:hypothetical protein FisN_25Lu201 [Fistulifera solaris]|eukprot:GAX28749.1 hypothetical protein FisN_25Lu201 [Fistulifera solaris]
MFGVQQRLVITRTRIRRFSGQSICRLEELDAHRLNSHLALHYQKQQPVIFRMSCDALTRWNNWDYLIDKVDQDWVGEVEMGAYNQGERVTLSFGEYMEYLKLWKQHEEEGDSEFSKEHLLYMAQNDLPASLHRDIQWPSIEFAENKWYNIHWWVGPRDTHSPLHYDPLDNYLFQIVGQKSVILFDASHPANALYTGSTWKQQNNTSAADVFDLDRHKFPNLDLNLSHQAILYPGDVLYIPFKWWHAVKSLSFSISVNAWWR